MRGEFKKLAGNLVGALALGFLLASCSGPSMQDEAAESQKAAKKAETAQPSKIPAMEAGSDTGEVKTAKNDNPNNYPSYKVVFGPPFPPFGFLDENNQLIGFNYDLLQAIAADRKIHFTFASRPFNIIFGELDKGNYDVVGASVAMTPDRVKNYAFSDPFFMSSLMAMTTKSDVDIKSVDDLKGKKVAIQAKSNSDVIMRKEANTEDMNISSKPTVYLGFKDVVTGKDDVIVSDSGPIIYLANKYKEYDPKLHAIEGIDNFYFGFVVSPTRSDNLLETINEGLKNIIASGKYAEIYKKYFKVDPPTLPSYKEVVANLNKNAEKKKPEEESTANGAKK